ncbi:hypothetical protein BC834DRAFT_286978 [Gloeopeniophorella convolvens]|nr:hypothetical protein BC834DRAFT_286978 [Gloeopeniophorella convolvens]
MDRFVHGREHHRHHRTPRVHHAQARVGVSRRRRWRRKGDSKVVVAAVAASHRHSRCRRRRARRRGATATVRQNADWPDAIATRLARCGGVIDRLVRQRWMPAMAAVHRHRRCGCGGDVGIAAAAAKASQWPPSSSSPRFASIREHLSRRASGCSDAGRAHGWCACLATLDMPACCRAGIRVACACSSPFEWDLQLRPTTLPRPRGGRVHCGGRRSCQEGALRQNYIRVVGSGRWGICIPPLGRARSLVDEGITANDIVNAIANMIDCKEGRCRYKRRVSSKSVSNLF